MNPDERLKIRQLIKSIKDNPNEHCKGLKLNGLEQLERSMA